MPNEPKPYDFVIIGGGPAGITAATELGDQHKSVALIDSHHDLGGAGVNTGTIPSKTLRETALALSGLQSRNLYGVDLSVRREVTVDDFLGHEHHVREAFNKSISHRLMERHADIYVGTAAFVDPHVLRVSPIAGGPQEEVLLRGENILLATGSSPIRPAIFPFDQGDVYDSDTVLNLHRIPKTMAVIGAGVIGSEYACTFAALGTQVHIIDGHDSLLPFIDPELSQALIRAMEKNGVVFHWKHKVEKCVVEETGVVTLTLSEDPPLTVESVLIAAGRQSNSGNLNLAAAGVTTGERGVVPVDGSYRTNVPHISAAGDIIGYPALASTSMAQGRLAVRHALGLEDPALAPVLPSGIYTIPEISVAGETEESCRKNNVACVVGRARYENNARGRIIGDSDGFLKLLFRQDDLKLLGVHIMGELATEVVHIGLMAMMCQASANLFVDACFNLPTLGMLYKNATLDALQKVPPVQKNA
jgi:NAD(P) transhydrogenase